LRTEAIDLPSWYDIGKHYQHLEANRTVRDRIVGRLKANTAGRSISVTDLLNVREAYWKRKRPDITVDLARREKMIAGSAFHDAFNWRVSSEAWVEQKVYFQDIAGRIDIYEEIPLELKTTNSPVAADELATSRPQYLEQLGMYCAMAGKPKGLLLIYCRTSESAFVGAEVEYPDLGAVERAMLERRDALRNALKEGDPACLPACAWAGKGCAYQAVCGCDTSEPTYPIARSAAVKPSSALATEFAERFLRSVSKSPAERAFSINDVVFPRKAFFKKTAGEAPADPDLAEELENMEQMQFMNELKFRALGGSGEYTSKAVQLHGVSGSVDFHEGRSLWFTRSGLKTVIDRDKLDRFFGAQLLRLAFNATLGNIGKSRLIIWYPNVVEESSRIMVYDLTWKNLDPFKVEMRNRVAALKAGVQTGEYEQLPLCPGWMSKKCDFAPKCGCGKE